MRKTEHYNLNQWDLSDEIKMEDFNRDNSLVDSALASLAAIAGKGDHIHIIAKGEPDSYCTGGFILRLEDKVSWDDYLMVLYVHLAWPLDSEPNTKMIFRTNITRHEIPYGVHAMLFFPMHNGANKPFHYLLLADGMIKSVKDTYADRPCNFVMDIVTETTPDNGHFQSGGYALIGIR